MWRHHKNFTIIINNNNINNFKIHKTLLLLVQYLLTGVCPVVYVFVLVMPITRKYVFVFCGSASTIDWRNLVMLHPYMQRNTHTYSVAESVIIKWFLAFTRPYPKGISRNYAREACSKHFARNRQTETLTLHQIPLHTFLPTVHRRENSRLIDRFTDSIIAPLIHKHTRAVLVCSHRVHRPLGYDFIDKRNWLWIWLNRVANPSTNARSRSFCADNIVLISLMNTCQVKSVSHSVIQREREKRESEREWYWPVRGIATFSDPSNIHWSNVRVAPMTLLLLLLVIMFTY